MGTTCLHFAVNWLGKKNMYEIYELRGLCGSRPSDLRLGIATID